MSTTTYTIQKSFNSALDKFKDNERRYLRHKFNDPLLWAFFEAQAAEARRQIDELDPSNVPTEDAQQFLMAAREARFVYQFWIDLTHYTRDWALEPDNVGQSR